jgi:hypothetical protein
MLTYISWNNGLLDIAGQHCAHFVAVDLLLGAIRSIIGINFLHFSCVSVTYKAFASDFTFGVIIQLGEINSTPAIVLR